MIELINQENHEKELLSAWAAGFFDGEGCIIIYKDRRKYKDKVYDYYRLIIDCAQIVKDPLVLLQNNWGGSLSHISASSNPQPIWKWRVCGENAKPFLEDILCYTTVKTSQIEIALEFINNTMGYREHAKEGPLKPLSPDVLKLKKAYKDLLVDIKKENKQGIKNVKRATSDVVRTNRVMNNSIKKGLAELEKAVKKAGRFKN